MDYSDSNPTDGIHKKCSNFPQEGSTSNSAEQFSKNYSKYHFTVECGTNSTKPGLALIVYNCLYSQTIAPRRNSQRDAEDLKEALTYLNFTVIFRKDQSVAEMKDLISSLSTRSNDYSCFVCAILTYSENDDHIYGTDDFVSFDSLLNELIKKENSTLAAKPKFFIVDTSPVVKVNVQHDGLFPSKEKSINYTRIPLWANLLIVSSGFCSESRTKDRSCFIQTLCSVLKEYGLKIELHQLMTQLNVQLSNIHNQNNHSGQLASVSSTMTKELRFKAHKEEKKQ
ncbi:caspase-7 [Octopus bimaculoides]|nr:caspase-7 [Octopus bimaculoides]|eukprot:XP_014771451.1 PREDICTED: caspase-7-like [Octopus bimaculoides]